MKTGDTDRCKGNYGEKISILMKGVFMKKVAFSIFLVFYCVPSLSADYGRFSPQNMMATPLKATPSTHLMSNKSKLEKCATAANKVIEEAKMIKGSYQADGANYELRYEVTESGKTKNIQVRKLRGKDMSISECIKNEIKTWELDSQNKPVVVTAVLSGICALEKTDDSSFNSKWTQTCKLEIYPR